MDPSGLDPAGLDPPGVDPTGSSLASSELLGLALAGPPLTRAVVPSSLRTSQAVVHVLRASAAGRPISVLQHGA